MSSEKEEFDQMLRTVEPEILEQLQERIQRVRQEYRGSRGHVRPADEGSPRDTLVQRLAAMMLRLLRRDEDLAYINRLRAEGKLSYDQIAELMGGGWSVQRVMTLYRKLAPFEYEEEKRQQSS